MEDWVKNNELISRLYREVTGSTLLNCSPEVISAWREMGSISQSTWKDDEIIIVVNEMLEE